MTPDFYMEEYPPVSARGRDAFMMPSDEWVLSDRLKEAFPDLRFWDQLSRTRDREFALLPISGMEQATDQEILAFLDVPDWEPEYSYRPGDTYRSLANLPPVSISLLRSRVKPVAFPDVKPIRAIKESRFLTNNPPDDREAKRLIDKALRLHRKLVFDAWEEIDLRTGKTLRRDKGGMWYMAGVVAACRDDPDLFMGVYRDRQTGHAWGYRPAM